MSDMIGFLSLEQLVMLFSLVFFVCLCVGSFLNVVIYRLPIMLDRAWRSEAKEILEQSVNDNNIEPGQRFNLALPSSGCPSCGAEIKAWQNIPVLSFLLLKGRCKSCQNKISFRYPLIEMFTGVLGTVLFWKFGLTLEFVALLVMTWLLIPLVGIDFDHQLLPDDLTLPLLWLGLLVNVNGIFCSLADAVIGAAAGYLSLWSVYRCFKLITGKEGMGYGDFKLLAVFGAWFGWQLLPNIILLSSVVGALLGIILIVTTKRDAQQPMSFGPFLAISGWLSGIFPSVFIMTNYIK